MRHSAYQALRHRLPSIRINRRLGLHLLDLHKQPRKAFHRIFDRLLHKRADLLILDLHIRRCLPHERQPRLIRGSGLVRAARRGTLRGEDLRQNRPLDLEDAADDEVAAEGPPAREVAPEEGVEEAQDVLVGAVPLHDVGEEVVEAVDDGRGADGGELGGEGMPVFVGPWEGGGGDSAVEAMQCGDDLGEDVEGCREGELQVGQRGESIDVQLSRSILERKSVTNEMIASVAGVTASGCAAATRSNADTVELVSWSGRDHSTLCISQLYAISWMSTHPASTRTYRSRRGVFPSQFRLGWVV